MTWLYVSSVIATYVGRWCSQRRRSSKPSLLELPKPPLGCVVDWLAERIRPARQDVPVSHHRVDVLTAGRTEPEVLLLEEMGVAGETIATDASVRRVQSAYLAGLHHWKTSGPEIGASAASALLAALWM